MSKAPRGSHPLGASSRIAATASRPAAILQPGADAALEVVRVASGEQWHAAGCRAVGWLAATGAPFSVWDVHLLGVGEPPDTPSRWGALMSAAAASGLLRPCGIEASRRASRRGAVVTVWIGATREAVAA